MLRGARFSGRVYRSEGDGRRGHDAERLRGWRRESGTAGAVAEACAGIAIVADLISFNRRIMEEALYRLRKLEAGGSRTGTHSE